MLNDVTVFTQCLPYWKEKLLLDETDALPIQLTQKYKQLSTISKKRFGEVLF